MEDIAGAIVVVAFLAFGARMLFGPLVIFGTKNNDYVINLQIPEAADEAIQKIAEAYRTLDKARTEHPLAEADVQAALLEARAIVAAHLSTRISIVTSSIEKLSKQRAGHLKDGIRSYAENDLKSIRLLETELGELQTQLGRPELKAV